MMAKISLRLPSVSLGRLGDVLDRTMALYVAYTLALFVVFVVATFPYQILVDRLVGMVESETVDIDFKEAHFAWHRGLALRQVRLSALAAETAGPLLEVETLWVRPVLAELVRGNPYALALRAELYGGAANGFLQLRDQIVSGTLGVEAVSLGRYRPLTSLLEEGHIAGRISGQVSFEAAGANIENAQVNGEVRLDNASLESAKISGFGVPDLHFASSRLSFAVRQGRLEIEQLNANGDEINVTASGQVTLREPIDSSVLNLKASVLPGKNAPDAIRGLIAMIPKPRDAKPDAPLRISGTLRNPRFR